MNKKDDEFERFLINKAKDEKSKFYTQASFDKKVEETLRKVDKSGFNKNKSWYTDKKLLAAAVAFIFIFSLSIIRYSMKNNFSIEMARSMEESSNESMELNDSDEAQSMNKDTFLNDIIDLKQIESIFINSVEVKDEEQISELLYLLNNLSLKRTTTELVEEDYKIEIRAEKTCIIYMKENLLLINGTVYQGNTHEVEKLQVEIKSIINS